MNDFPEIADLEVLELRKKVKELEAKLAERERVLEEHDLLDKKSTVSMEEEICVRELERYNMLSKQGGLQTEDVKNVEVLVKTLYLAKGKTPPPETKAKKKQENTDIGKLLALAAVKSNE